MSVVVTGASGHVGANLVRRLLDQRRKVRVVIHRDVRALEGLAVERVAADVLDPASLERALAGAEVVYHLAARISIRLSDRRPVQAVNATGTRNVVRACLECGVGRLVHFSSIHALRAEPADEPVDETRPLALGTNCLPYDRSKALADEAVLAGIEEGLDAVILNPTAVIGPNDFKPSRIGEVIRKLMHGRLPVLVRGGFNWVDVRDVVEGACAAAEKGATADRGIAGRRYLLAGHWCPVGELADLVGRLSGTPRPRRTIPSRIARLAFPLVGIYTTLTRQRPLYTLGTLRILQSYRHVSHERATNELAYRPRPLEQTLRDTIAWFREHEDLFAGRERR